MAITAVLTVDGVLRHHSAETPVREGVALYHALLTGFKVALVTTDTTVDRAERWLRLQGLTEHAYLLETEPVVDNPRLRQVMTLKTRGSDVSLVIDPDPAVVQQTMLAGIPSMLFVHPQYARPEWRPDHRGAVQPWADLAAEMDRQALLRQNDTRTDAEMM